jgi:hypothetical protein
MFTLDRDTPQFFLSSGAAVLKHGIQDYKNPEATEAAKRPDGRVPDLRSATIAAAEKASAPSVPERKTGCKGNRPRPVAGE